MTRILVIPGIGDIHWVALKLESFIARHCPGERPEVFIWNFDGRPRSQAFVERLPFVRFGGYWHRPIDADRAVFQQAYMTGDLDAAPRFRGFDWFLCFNGSLRVGRSMDQILPDCATNWQYPLEPRESDNRMASTIGEPYVLAYFTNHGMFASHWWPRLGASRIRGLLSSIDAKVILTGSEWDCESAKELQSENTIDLTGQTSFADLMGLMRNCQAFVGWCGGNTILSSHMGIPTLMLWSDYFNKRFQMNWANPSTIGTTYRPADVETFNDANALKWIQRWTSNSKNA